MGKKTQKPAKAETPKSETRNHLGTSQDMVLKVLEQPVLVQHRAEEDVRPHFIIAEDDQGLYFTDPHWVGNNLMDPNRHHSCQRKYTSLTSEQKLEHFPPPEEKEEEKAEEAEGVEASAEVVEATS
jgi:hypothetical protein